MKTPVQVGQVYEIVRDFAGNPLPLTSRRRVTLTRKSVSDANMWHTDLSGESVTNVEYSVAKGEWVLVGGPGSYVESTGMSSASWVLDVDVDLGRRVTREQLLEVLRTPASVTMAPTDIVAACDANRAAFVVTTPGADRLPGRRPWGPR